MITNKDVNPASPAPKKDKESGCSSSVLEAILAPLGNWEDARQFQVGDLEWSQMEHARLLAELAKVKQICDIGVSSLIILDSLDGSKFSIAGKVLAKMEYSLVPIR